MLKQLCRGLLSVTPLLSPVLHAQTAPTGTIHSATLTVQGLADGTYSFAEVGASKPVVHAAAAIDRMGSIIDSSRYPKHLVSRETFHDSFGAGDLLRIRNTGLASEPDLLCDLRLYRDLPWGTIQVTAVNETASPVDIHALRFLQTVAGSGVDLDGPASADRVLPDSFSEDTPQLRIVDLDAAKSGRTLAFGSQLLRNRQSGKSFFLGALTAERFLTIARLTAVGDGDKRLATLVADSTGTTEAEPDQNGQYPLDNQVPLRVHLQPGERLSSEAVQFAIGSDYHQQLENYGAAVRAVNHARTTAPTPIGWWSWTAFYYGVTEANTLTNAEWLTQNLLPLGYRYFQIDEGYQFARGEYATADRTNFPRGVAYIGDEVRRLGLTFGVWVAPFQVSERSWVYQHHPEWLVHTAAGQPVHIGRLAGHFENLYALDTTHPGAQEYLRSTYRTLVRDWGVRFIKMDFMDSSAVEGVHDRPNTSALQALRIGLQVIRDAVGEDVVLDKDGSPMLTPVGIVDAGRTSQDTGHTFESTRDAATGIAARYYMNRNFYITDPDAFTVSTQTIPDRGWHGNKAALTQDEAEASIALSAVSGGMFEIGDDLPTLGTSPERLALVKNQDLVNMARLGRAAIPLDLMTFRQEDLQPSIFLLHQTARQSVVTLFNWTEEPQTHTVPIASLGIAGKHHVNVTDVLRGNTVPVAGNAITVMQPPHSVRMLKLVDADLPPTPPRFQIEAVSTTPAGVAVPVSASPLKNSEPAIRTTWNFGDGVSAEGATAQHAYTLAGTFTITATAYGIDGLTTQQQKQVTVTGAIPTVYDPARKQRFTPDK